MIDDDGLDLILRWLRSDCTIEDKINQNISLLSSGNRNIYVRESVWLFSGTSSRWLAEALWSVNLLGFYASQLTELSTYFLSGPLWRKWVWVEYTQSYFNMKLISESQPKSHVQTISLCVFKPILNWLMRYISGSPHHIHSVVDWYLPAGIIYSTTVIIQVWRDIVQQEGTITSHYYSDPG